MWLEARTTTSNRSEYIRILGQTRGEVGMRLLRTVLAGFIATASAAGLTSGAAWAQDEEPGPEGDPAEDGADADPGKEGIEGGGFDNYEKAGMRKQKEKPEYGMGLRLRGVFEPKGVIELFIEEASGGVFSPGFGVEFLRRKGNFELVLGLEYENVSPPDGHWLEKGDDGVSPGQYPDYVEFDGLAWFTADLAFMFHNPINDKVSFRYGAGFGLGIVLGEVLQTDQICTGRDFDSQCTDDTTGQINDEADIPPVFPVIDLILGVQFKPTKKMTVNLEGGLRTLFFFGISAGYFF